MRRVEALPANCVMRRMAANTAAPGGSCSVTSRTITFSAAPNPVCVLSTGGRWPRRTLPPSPMRRRCRAAPQRSRRAAGSSAAAPEVGRTTAPGSMGRRSAVRERAARVATGGGARRNGVARGDQSAIRRSGTEQSDRSVSSASVSRSCRQTLALMRLLLCCAPPGYIPPHAKVHPAPRFSRLLS